MTDRDDATLARAAHDLDDEAAELLGWEWPGQVGDREALRRHAADAGHAEAIALLAEADALYWQLALRWRQAAYRTARRVAMPEVEPEDAMQSALVGMYRAALRWDPRRARTLGQYGCHWVRRVVQDDTPQPALSIPAAVRERRWTRDTYRAYYALSLDAPVAGEDDRCLADLQADDTAIPHITAQQRRDAQAVLDELDERTRRILVEVAKGRSYAEVGRRIGLSRERVRVLYDSAVEKARRALGLTRTESTDDDGAGPAARDVAVLRAVRGGASTPDEVAAHTGRGVEAVRQSLARLAEVGLLEGAGSAWEAA